ncbi:hypothetical protein BATDEDRAFT_89915 [Batrachochytrium dendrobatidis JAM81]|uniref:Uncharacterized protein n=1 Tax=Batrachochytrium dendrobatidis (strain JAM81 / FGSC 10211) TaxID=684364 RepID=F4P5Z7_BATDJ|nr:uncharacterized protein BATDEDRAFT_89915 [Batrachochytrium dendrobatidis JAM81]EGF79267.1 hypothetical protein BATDEDRAFT_89915 [Batrachochytrium dendrobatidis JAM81]|eukprot:XP_006680081.1 hypothetical protein BATDEDRAFT_89915 [Batrachochytrium dendrobatidis JAM81]
MKLVDILLVLSAAATANAILIPFKKDGSLQESGTSSQVSVPTNEPNPGTSDQDWQSIAVQPGLSISDEYWKHLIDEAGSSIPKDLQQPVNQPDSSTSGQDQQYPVDQPGLSISDEYWKQLIDEADSSTPEDLQKLSDIVEPSTSKQGQQYPVNQPSPSTPKRGRKRPIDLTTSDEDQQYPVNQPSPSTPKQSRKRPIDVVKPSNTAPYQKVEKSKVIGAFNLQKELRATIREQESAYRLYRDYAAAGLEQKSKLEKGLKVIGIEHDLKLERQLKQDCKDIKMKISILKQRLRDFILAHGSKFKILGIEANLEVDSEADSD